MTLSIQHLCLAPQTPRGAISLLALLTVLIACQLVQIAESRPSCQDGWLPVGQTDCILIGQAPLNISQARQYCLSLGNNSRLIFLRNQQFNELLLSALLSSRNETNATTTELSASYWTGARVTDLVSLEWLDANYTDFSMSKLPGATPVLSRYSGRHGALKLIDNSILKLNFIDGSTNSSAALCARQPIQSPYRDSVQFDSKLRCDGANATLHRGLCYRVLNSPKSSPADKFDRDLAVQACRNWSAEASLAVINDFNTQFLATALIGSTAHGHAWISLEYMPDKYWAWQVNGTGDMRHSDWKLGEPSTPFKTESCVVAHQREVSLGEWNNVPCTDRFFSALCQAPPSKLNTSHVPSPIGILHSSPASRCRPGFYAYGDICWTLAAGTNGNRSDMAAECANQNASLALFHHRGEQAFLSALADQLGVNLTNGPAVWLGLNVEPDESKHGWLLTWDDGSSADYDFVFKILPTQLKNSDTQRYLCTALNLQSNSLEARLCNDTDPLMACRYNLVDHPFSPNKSQNLRCPDGEEPAVNGKCYKLYNTNANWTDADAACAKVGGSLASVHSRQEQLVISKKLKNLSPSDEAWLGMTVSFVEGQQHLIWSEDGGTGVQFFQFRHGYPKLPLSMPFNTKACVSISGKYGEWMTEVCSKTLPYICQTPGLPLTTSTLTSSTTTTASSIASTTTTVTPTAASNNSSTVGTTAPAKTPVSHTTGSSSGGGGDRPVCKSPDDKSNELSIPMPDGSGCLEYLFVDKTDSGAKQSWQDANNICQKHWSNAGQLASIGSMNESKAVFTFLKQFSADKVWLGASTSLSPVANAYSAWSDGSPMRFADFIPLDNPPDQSVDLAKSLCVAMETRPDSKYPGQFWSMDCNTRQAFLCKRSRLFDRLSTAAPEPAGRQTYACPDGFVAASSTDSACYRLLPTAVPYPQAEAECKASHSSAQLASYQTQAQLQRMASLLAEAANRESSLLNPQSAWIGLEFKAGLEGGVFGWTDGRPVLATDWAAFADTQKYDCVRLSSSPYWWLSGHMSTEQCSKKLRPLCRVSGVPVAVAPPASSAGCPSKFARFGSACYEFRSADSVATFADAQAACRSLNSSASSRQLLELEQGGFAQSAELHFLRSAAISVGSEVWLGLTSQGGNWSWRSDSRPLRSDLLYPAVAVGHLTPAAVSAGSTAASCYSLSLGWGLRSATNCSDKFAYICKRLVAGQPAVATPAPDPNYSTCLRSRSLVGEARDGRACIRWDVALATRRSSLGARAFVAKTDAAAADRLKANEFVSETVGSAAAYCRNVSSVGVGSSPVCFVTAAQSPALQLQLAYCSLPQCFATPTTPTSSGNSGNATYSSTTSVAVAVVLALCSAAALAGLIVIGVRLWRRGRWAAGYRPQLNLDAATGLAAGGGGTSFHNPIYMPANC
ncbi:hypothetical protein BOX15_Mlig019801g1 [Macrostomum lignano]|uniref:C-type lectin domain-containing protein n=1 Tax=Macrostomum lignano TaxID=282301 RepID=A0A267GRV9_9PLAT|nr:hypothetical protein BOX15_Mlig019801g1 [Macrostomum lignano]